LGASSKLALAGAEEYLKRNNLLKNEE